MRLQEIGGADAGELQELRRIIGAAGHQHFFPCARGAQFSILLVFDRLRAAPLEQEALRQRRSLHMQIGAAHRRPQIGIGAGGAAAAPRRGLEEAGAFLGLAVEIRIEGNAGLDRGLHEGFRQRILVPPVRHRERPAGAVKLVLAALLVLRLPEIRQHVVKTPADIAALAPAVVVLVLAAHIEQAVDRARSAQHFSARLEHLPAAEARLRLGLVHPVDRLLLEQLAVAERHMDPDVAVLRARPRAAAPNACRSRSADWRARIRQSRRRR